MFRIENISKKFDGGIEPIHGLSVIINKGDVISLIGPSGTGKSTFLRCLNLLDPPTSGDIFYKGERITEKGYDFTAHRQKVGMVFQSFNLFNHLTAIENIMMPQEKLLHRSRQEAYDNGMRLLEQVGLSDRSLQYPGQLSGGQKQRVAIARAMAMDPEVLLLDEPTSALDPTMVDEVNDVIGKLASSGMTILIVTHDMAFARTISNRIFYMDEGIVYEEGSPVDIFEHPQKQKTIQFVKKMFLLEETINSRDYDFSGLTKKVYELMLQKKSFGTVWNNTVLLMEEIIQNLLFSLLKDPVRIHLRLECKKQSNVLVIEYGGDELDLVSLINEKAQSSIEKDPDDLLPLTARLIRGYAKEMSYARQERELRNCLTVIVGESGTRKS